jgi:hypothetical protein
VTSASITMAEQTSTLNGSAVSVNRLSKPRWWQERLRSAPTTKCVLTAALVILLALGAPVYADDPIADWLKQDESDGQNDQIRPDLHALADQQLQDIFKIGRNQGDDHQLIERVSEQHPRVLYIWFVTIAAGFGAVIGAVKAVPFVRRQLRTLAVLVQTKDQSTDATPRRTSTPKMQSPAYLTQITLPTGKAS